MRKLSTALVTCAVLLLAGCVMVPVPASKRVEGPKGRLKVIDYAFIEIGKTKRSEVTEKLASIDLGMKNPELFLGRFRSSKTAIGGAMLGPPIMTPFGGRVWKSNNLLITFDAKGTVQRVQNISDGQLDKELLRWLASHQQPSAYPFRLRAFVYHDGLQGEGDLVFEEHHVRFVETEQYRHTWGNMKMEKIRITNPDLVTLELESTQLKNFFGDAADDGKLTRDLLFKRSAQRRADRTVSIGIAPTPDELIAVLSYIQRFAPGVKYAAPKW